jgi:xylan 1,4-beta-xylosidase
MVALKDSAGAFVGLWAWDLTGGGLPADFDEAAYRSVP